jgi:hypothetical protein
MYFGKKIKKKKKRDFKHSVKHSLQIQLGESLEDVMATTPNLHLLDADAIECCVEMWLTKEDRVRQIHMVIFFLYIFKFIYILVIYINDVGKG